MLLTILHFEISQLHIIVYTCTGACGIRFVTVDKQLDNPALALNLLDEKVLNDHRLVFLDDLILDGDQADVLINVECAQLPLRLLHLDLQSDFVLMRFNHYDTIAWAT